MNSALFHAMGLWMLYSASVAVTVSVVALIVDRAIDRNLFKTVMGRFLFRK